MPEYMNNPRYQRALKRLRRLGPEQRAILSTDEIMSAIASDEARKQLQYMALGEQKASRIQRGQLAEKSLALQARGLGLREDALKYERKQANKAEVLGWGNVGLSGIAGWMDLKEKASLSKRLGNLAGLYRAGMS